MEKVEKVEASGATHAPWQREFFKKIKAAAPDYPIKFALFDSGSHGTPIRMTDWRLILNWMLAVDKR